ncbi:YciI family protein [Devosia sp. RR2S18]|uniref:YciI family protein n=1 Tax=Devosia rhizosphaerae TaxID=3049774 RepID=UPI002540A226|nr:YciI family protein [Devosia sp. RR2S18]WIJ25516.1 YciI family protein [Devosia sp. RR2S18]
MLYAMIAKDRPGTTEQRTAVRPVHLDHLHSLGDKMVLAGAMLDGNGVPEGSLMVIEAESLQAATATFEADPFVKEGIFASYEIKPWRIAINNMAKGS